jgi:hypothetical protein
MGESSLDDRSAQVLPYNIFAYCSICRVDCKFARNKKKYAVGCPEVTFPEVTLCTRCVDITVSYPGQCLPIQKPSYIQGRKSMTHL